MWGELARRLQVRSCLPAHAQLCKHQVVVICMPGWPALLISRLSTAEIPSQTMRVMDTIWVSIVSTIPGLNVPKWINVFRYFTCLLFTVYLVVLVWEHNRLLWKVLHGLNFELHCDLKAVTWELVPRSTRPSKDLLDELIFSINTKTTIYNVILRFAIHNEKDKVTWSSLWMALTNHINFLRQQNN